MTSVFRWVTMASCLGLVGGVSPALADDVDQMRAKYERCETAVSSADAAADAEDWAKAEQFAKKALKSCAEAGDGPFYLAGIQATLGQAQIERRDYKAALATAEQCIDTYYASPDCHLLKVKALANLHRKTEAGRAKAVAGRLCLSLVEAGDTTTSSVDDQEARRRKLQQRRAKRVLQELEDYPFPE